jgi:hypothetical protein
MKKLKSDKPIIKFNSGALALLCNKCRTILMTGKQCLDVKEAQYCENCNKQAN